MPRRKLLLHIGIHKTGTTAIQYLLLHNAKLLAEQGFLVPQSGRPSYEPFGHHGRGLDSQGRLSPRGPRIRIVRAHAVREHPRQRWLPRREMEVSREDR